MFMFTLTRLLKLQVLWETEVRTDCMENTQHSSDFCYLFFITLSQSCFMGIPLNSQQTEEKEQSMTNKDSRMMNMTVTMATKMNITEPVTRRTSVLGGSSTSEDIRDNNKTTMNSIELNSASCRYVVLIWVISAPKATNPFLQELFSR